MTEAPHDYIEPILDTKKVLALLEEQLMQREYENAKDTATLLVLHAKLVSATIKEQFR